MRGNEDATGVQACAWEAFKAMYFIMLNIVSARNISHLIVTAPVLVHLTHLISQLLEIFSKCKCPSKVNVSALSAIYCQTLLVYLHISTWIICVVSPIWNISVCMLNESGLHIIMTCPNWSNIIYCSFTPQIIYIRYRRLIYIQSIVNCTVTVWTKDCGL